ncbi:hypothetical protein Cgig2_017167 [Carnegiea gigantea]|uniref:Uncharacterized protein n=1 Tax=Carnegiea gigantea TaxID=171969 RepID=A0A9Q1KAY0_9CARY|nr:hypothetical protein Cgig2_017167 [Carnegiea gigantea]
MESTSQKYFTAAISFSPGLVQDPSSGSNLARPLKGVGSYFSPSITIVGGIHMLVEGPRSELYMDTSRGYDTGLPKEWESRDRELLELSVRAFGLVRRNSRNGIAAGTSSRKGEFGRRSAPSLLKSPPPRPDKGLEDNLNEYAVDDITTMQK